MSYAEDVMKEIEDNKQGSLETTAQPAETVTPEPEPVKEPEPEPEKQPEPDPEPSPDPAPDPEPSPEPEKQPEDDAPAPADAPKPKPKKDLSNLSKEEKAEFAFARQLAKQKSKYEQSIEDIKKTFQGQLDEIKQSIKPKAETKSRSDFETDDEYIAHLTEQGVNKVIAERDAAAKKAAEENEARAKEAEEIRERQQKMAESFNANCRKCFEDEAQYKDFSAKVQRGIDNGLAELLDENPVVREYLLTNPSGPIVLNEMLNSRDAFVRVMGSAYNPIEATITMHDMAKEIASRPPVQQESAPAPKGMPNLGKPGSARGPSAPTMWNSDDSLLDFVRSHR